MSHLRLTILLVLLSLATASNLLARSIAVDFQVNQLDSCSMELVIRYTQVCNSNAVLALDQNWIVLQGGCPSPGNFAGYPQTTITEVTPVCNGTTTNCSDPNSSIPGIFEEEIRHRYYLCSQVGCEYYFETTAFEVNPLIDNLAPSSFWDATIHNQYHYIARDTRGNSTPELLENGILQTCARQRSAFALFGPDPDGDSVVYSIAPVMRSRNLPYTYALSYFYTTPMGNSWDVSIGPQGVLSLDAQPGYGGRFLINIEVEEYRQGDLVATSNRYVTVDVVDCVGALSPRLTAVPAPNSGGTLIGDTLVFCPGDAVRFFVQASGIDSTAGDITIRPDSLPGNASVSALNNPGVSIDSLTSSSPEVLFEWSNPVPGIYEVGFLLEQSACPTQYFGRNTVTLIVGPEAVPATISSNAPNLNSCYGQIVDLTLLDSQWQIIWNTGFVGHEYPVNVAGTYYADATYRCLTATDTFVLNQVTISLLEGSVRSQNNLPLASQPVFLYGCDTARQRLILLDSTLSNVQGRYEFCEAPLTDFTIQVIPDSSQYPLDLPTYFNDKAYWNRATNLSSNPVVQVVNIQTRRRFLTIGQGSIGGHILHSTTHPFYAGSPADSIRVFIQDFNGSVLGHTLTDANGHFHFPNLSAGAHRISVDVPFVDEDTVPIVTLPNTWSELDQLQFTLYPTHLALETGTFLAAQVLAETGIHYKNNGAPVFWWKHLPESNWQIFTLDGKEIEESEAEGNGQTELPELPAGMYVLRVSNQEQVFTHKLIYR